MLFTIVGLGDGVVRLYWKGARAPTAHSIYSCQLCVARVCSAGRFELSLAAFHVLQRAEIERRGVRAGGNAAHGMRMMARSGDKDPAKTMRGHELGAPHIVVQVVLESHLKPLFGVAKNDNVFH